MYFYINLQQSSTVEKINYTWGYCAQHGKQAPSLRKKLHTRPQLEDLNTPPETPQQHALNVDQNPGTSIQQMSGASEPTSAATDQDDLAP